MSQHIHSWIDGHLALRTRAYEMRGFCEAEGVRWPRTSGADVIAIAAIIDPAIKRHGTPGVVRRWRQRLTDLEHDALPVPHATFEKNRPFWATLEAAAVFLDDVAVRPPEPEVWDALLATFHTVRNSGPKGDGPFKHFDNIQTYHDLYEAQIKHLIETRGADELEAPPLDDNSYGTSGIKKKIPRATNLDVLALAGYWGTALDDVKEVFGREGIERRWNRAMQDVVKLAMHADPTKPYPKNNQFFRELFETAVHVSVADEAPSKWDMAVDSVKHSVQKLPQTIKGAAGKAADFVGGAAHAAGKVLNEAGRGLFSGLGAPILIGAGLLGVFIIARRPKDAEEK
jgi:hypothetical protein